MGFEYIWKFNKELGKDIVEMLKQEVIQFPNTDIEKRNDEIVIWWTHYDSKRNDTSGMGDIVIMINEVQCYVCINGSRYAERNFLFYMLNQVFRLHDIQCEFEEL